jgi:hypothetical protein
MNDLYWMKKGLNNSWLSFSGWTKDSIIHEGMSFTGWKKDSIIDEWALPDEERGISTRENIVVIVTL